MMYLILPLASLAVTVFLHFLSGFLMNAAVMRFAGCVAIVGAALVAICYQYFGFTPGSISVIISFFALAELYLFAFTLCMASVSVNILIRIADGQAHLPTLDLKYNSDQMVKLRILRLEEAGLIRSDGNTLALEDKSLRVLSGSRTLRKLFGHT